MRCPDKLAVAIVLLLLGACAETPDKRTLASLHEVKPDTSDVQVSEGLDKAMQSYRRFLEETPDSALRPEAMRRLADLKIEKEYGVQGDGKTVQPAGPAKAQLPSPGETKLDTSTTLQAKRGSKSRSIASATAQSSEQELEKRATAQQEMPADAVASELDLPDGVDGDLERAGPLEAIKLYDELLAKYPAYAFRDQVLYQKARAYDELGRTAESMKVMEQLVAEFPGSRYVDEVQFRRAEHFFARRKYREAERAYAAIADGRAGTEYYELALYKLGWALYKQEFYEEALHRYFALLDYKVSQGYDFDGQHDEEEERRVEDTFQVVSLSFSNLGGTEVIGEYFADNGRRPYEDRVYRYLGEFYLAKLRYNDAATIYKSFVSLYPFHAASPKFSMRVIEIYEVGGFPKLVLDSKKEFATRYGLQAEYWRHFELANSQQVLAYLKSNLKDLANHYHAQYQAEAEVDQRPANYAEAARWYREFLASFREDPQSPLINYQLADLVRENKDYAGAAKEYERTAYEYAAHEKSAAAGYAAIYAHRENLKVVNEPAKEAALRDTVASSLRFSETFPQHEHAAMVLGAAAEDLYDLKDFALARTAAQKLIDTYPNAAAGERRTAWLVVAHSSFDLADYAQAEMAYTKVLEATAPEHETRAALVENLAASIYKQGEKANELGDYRAAANHFLRVKQAAPTSKICAAAEYDAGAALIRLQDWMAAADVLESFRRTYPGHDLEKAATRQIASVYEQAGNLQQAAGEYERVAAESENPELRAEALLLAGKLYEQSQGVDRALDVYTRYLEQFPQPLETAVETRSRMAAIHKARNDVTRYHEQLRAIVKVDAEAGSERTGRTRNIAARSALVLSELSFERFAATKLVQPFDLSLQQKRREMDEALGAFSNLVGYEVGEVTAAATFYMAETYSNFSRSLVESERPAGLSEAAAKDYELALEEEAFPFEEKAIEVHEKNLELIRSGVYNGWTEKSLAQLAVLKPGRYAKTEISSGFLGSVDRFVYRQPEKPVAPIETGSLQPADVPPSVLGIAPPADADAAPVSNTPQLEPPEE